MSAHDVDRHTFGIDCWRGPVQPMVRAHRHDDIEVNVADVDLTYVIDGRTHVLPAGSVSLFWAARPHRLDASSGAGRQAWVTIPLARALAWGLPGEVVRRLVHGEVLTTRTHLPLSAGAAEEWAERVGRWQRELHDAGPHAEVSRRVALMEIEAAASRWAWTVDGEDGDAVGDAPRPATGHAGAMIAYLSEHARHDVTVADVAAHVHLHPQYAMTLFRRAVGITVGEYLAQCRVAHAQQLLLSTELPVPDVGFAAGFRSLSQFYDRFGRMCGESPGAYRRRLREAGPAGLGEARTGALTPTRAR
ncbi:helix-turn-helix domain-containing protein [Microbacterium sp. PA5]|uniref:helix-turn-helix domain-containing protein n=1 Tax=Microbacterium sp. PA5 TaxID=3416654 RepID=UPI003CF5ED7F